MVHSLGLGSITVWLFSYPAGIWGWMVLQCR